MEKIEIPLNRKKSLWLTLGGLLFISIGVLMIFVITDFRWNVSYIIFQLMGLLGLIFGGIAMYFGVTKLFNKKPGLVIDTHGIIDQSGSNELGFIPWKEVSAIELTSVMDVPIILVFLKNPNFYLEQTGGINKTILKHNYDTYGTPLAISGNTIVFDFYHLNNLLNTFFKKYGS